MFKKIKKLNTTIKYRNYYSISWIKKYFPTAKVYNFQKYMEFIENPIFYMINNLSKADFFKFATINGVDFSDSDYQDMIKMKRNVYNNDYKNYKKLFL